MLATSDELTAVSSRSLATADSGLFGIPSSSSGFPGVVSGLGDLPQQTHHSRFMPESLVPVDPINLSPAQLSHRRPEWLDLQPPSHRRLPRENPSTVLNRDALEGRSGVWTVGESGQVSVDYLIDGGSFQGELAVFSLQGMETLQPGSPAFTQEAARRALSQSVFGHVVISDAAEGARFDGSPGESPNWNSGQYRGGKTYNMRPGDHFGLMLVPNASVQSVLEARVARLTTPAPLFSLSMANRGQVSYLAQLDDAGLAAPDDGGVFVMEDTPAQRGSIADFNDLIFQVAGATAAAPRFETVIQPQNDWRQDLLPLMAAPSAPAENASGPVASSNLKRLANTIELQFNGSATQITNGLRLTPASSWQAGSAFMSTPIAVNARTSFQTQFQFQLTGGTNGTAGFTFVLQSSPQGASALGGSGGSLGYGGTGTPSLAIEFDTVRNAWDVNNNHLAVLRDGNVRTALATASTGLPDLNSGAAINAWIDYNGNTDRLDVFVAPSKLLSI